MKKILISLVCAFFLFSNIPYVHAEETIDETTEETAETVETSQVENLKLTVVSNTSIKITWDQVEDATSYVLTRVNDGKQYSVTATSYTDKKLMPATAYSYTVQAIKEDGQGEVSSTATISTTFTAPASLTYSCNSDTCTFNWDEVNGASYYQLFYSKDNVSFTKITNITSTSYSLKGLSNNQTYYFKVRGVYKYSKDGKNKYINGSYVTTNGKVCYNGWVYKSSMYFYYDHGTLVKDLRNNKNTKSSVASWGKKYGYVIKVNKTKSYATVYTKKNSKGYVVPVFAMACSPGKNGATPAGTFYTKAKYRWHLLYGAYGQYCTRITGHILFHSILYRKANNHTLVASSYNNLGKAVSHGCVRLRVIDAKWIYDNCKLKTKVVISTKVTAPLGKPSYGTIKSTQNYDPSDPNA